MEQEDNAHPTDAGIQSSELADGGAVQRDTAASSPSSECNTGGSSVCSSGAAEGAGSAATAAEEEEGREEGLGAAKGAVSPAAAPARKGEVDDSSSSSSPAPGKSLEQQTALDVDDGSTTAIGGVPRERQEEGGAGLVRVESAPSLKRPSEGVARESRSEDLRKVRAW